MTTKKDEKLDHDSFFKTTFGKPERTAELLSLAAKHNNSLAELISAVNLNTLQPMPGEATREELTGAADLAFQVNLKGSEKMANLHVGMILEHKSYPDNGVLQQLMHYYFEVILQKAGNIPTVAIIVYNGNRDWNPLEDPSFKRPYPQYPDYFNRVGYPFICEFIDVGDEVDMAEFVSADPQLALALLAMRYAFEPSEHDRFVAAIKAFVALGREGALEFIKEVFVYLHKLIPATEKELFMDTAEAYANKGYESIYDVDCKRAHDEGKTEGYNQARTEFTETIKAKDDEIASKDAKLAAKDDEIASQAAYIKELEAQIAAKPR